MYYEYALEPTLLNTWERFRYFVEKFGWHHGRLIVEYPKHWHRMVYESLTTCADREKHKIIEKMSRLKERTIRRKGAAAYDGTRDWLPNALVEHARLPFFAIIAAQNPEGSAAVLIADDADEDTLIAPAGIIPRRPEDVAAAMSLMIRQARQVVLADPYFAPDKPRFRSVFQALLTEAGPNTEFVIHTSIDRRFEHNEDRNSDDEQRVAANLRRDFEARPFVSLLPAACTVRVHIWKRRQGGERFHNRYVLTEFGGITFGTGLDAPTDATNETDDLARLPPEQHAQRYAQFSSTPAFDRACESFELKGRRR